MGDPPTDVYAEVDDSIMEDGEVRQSTVHVDSQVKQAEADSPMTDARQAPANAPKAPLLHSSAHEFVEPAAGSRKFMGYSRARNTRTTNATKVNAEEVPQGFQVAAETPVQYPDRYDGPGHDRVLEGLMSEFGIERREGDGGRREGRGRGGRDRRGGRDGGGGGGGGGDRRGYQNNNRKRFRDDDDEEQVARPPRRRYEEPVASRLRRELVTLAEQPARTIQDEVAGLGRDIANNFEDDQVKGPFLDTLVQLLSEQPLKIPFVAAVVLYANDLNPEVAKEIITRAAGVAKDAMELGRWRDFKLLLRFFACLQGVLEGAGVFAVLNQLFDWVIDLQTESTEDALGLDLTKTILLTIPYALASNATDAKEKLGDLLDKTEIVTSEAAHHPLAMLVDPYPSDSETKPFGYQSVAYLLQNQLRLEESNDWPLKCIPRIYKSAAVAVEGENGVKEATKHALPALTVPVPVDVAKKPLFPDTYFTVYGDQEIATTPDTTNVASTLIRDVLADTINILDINRHVCARFMIEMDLYWAPNTFASRGISLDQLKNYPVERSRWKPEDMMIDAIFAQIFTLPRQEHKLVYYHALLTESCKLAPGQIAPTLGRAIRWLFLHIDEMDMELSYRFLDWFAHHLSNFEFRWKWIEWIDDVKGSPLTPKTAFIIAAIDKEIRLSFAKRIRETLPKEYHHLITEGKFKDSPDYKYNNDKTPYAEEGREIYKLMKNKALEAEIQPYIDAIHEKAVGHGDAEPLIASTDVYTTAMCFIGSKSLSHVISQIEKCKDRLLEVGEKSELARQQIVRSVVSYWKDQTGIAVNIVDKLLNYTIVTPESVIFWALGPESLANGGVLAEGWRYEMVSVTVHKVTNRVRQIVAAKVATAGSDISAEQLQQLDDTLTAERQAMRQLFATIEDAVAGVASGAADGFIESDPSAETAALVKAWGERWARIFRRKLAVEEAVVGEAAVAAQAVSAAEQAKLAVIRAEREAEAEAERMRKWDEIKAIRIKEEEEERVKVEAERAAREEKFRLEVEGASANGNGNGKMDEDEAVNGEADADMDVDIAE